MDELDALFDALKRRRFLTVLTDIVKWKKANMPTTNITSLIHWNPDVSKIIKESGWSDDDFYHYYIGYHRILRKELDQKLKEKNDN